jgi:glycosyltransferase involved in cell wall biosynthesis
MSRTVNNEMSYIIKKPLISVIMNCYNGEKYLESALQSVLNQTYKNFEIIIWDNASNDSTQNIVSKYKDKVRYYRGKKKTTLYDARNLALDKCKGEYVTFLDCDDIWVKDKLERQQKMMSPSIQIVYGGYSIIDARGSVIGNGPSKLPSGFITNQLLISNPVSIGCVMAKRELLIKYRFNSNYELLGDFDMWVNLSVYNKFECIQTPLEYSRVHGENTSIRMKKDWVYERREFYSDFLRKFGFFRYFSIIYYIFKTEIRNIFVK